MERWFTSKIFFNFFKPSATAWLPGTWWARSNLLLKRTRALPITITINLITLSSGTIGNSDPTLSIQIPASRSMNNLRDLRRIPKLNVVQRLAVGRAARVQMEEWSDLMETMTSNPISQLKGDLQRIPHLSVRLFHQRSCLTLVLFVKKTDRNLSSKTENGSLSWKECKHNSIQEWNQDKSREGENDGNQRIIHSLENGERLWGPKSQEYNRKGKQPKEKAYQCQDQQSWANAAFLEGVIAGWESHQGSFQAGEKGQEK